MPPTPTNGPSSPEPASAGRAAPLAALVGRWSGGGELFPNPWGFAGPVEGVWTFRLDRSGHNLIHDYVEQRANGEIFEGHGVLTIDPASQEIVWFWFDSYGFPPLAPARGAWNGEELRLEKTTPRGSSTSRFHLSGGRLSYAVEARLTGAAEANPIMRGVFVRDEQGG